VISSPAAATSVSSVITDLRNYSIRPAKSPWYGIRTRSNHEKLVAAILDSKGYQHYLPVYRRRQRWSDRVVTTEVPLFPGYVFCRFDHQKRLPIMTTFGVVSIIGFGTDPAPIPDTEIEAIERVLESGFGAEPHPFLRIGQRVRVTQGALKDLEGILIQRKSDCRLVVSVSMLQRSVSVEIDCACISAI
jgi:transcription antitermination factor NusG